MNKFPSADALASQMHVDETRIRTILGLTPEQSKVPPA
jgi:FAD synthase